MRRLRRPPQPQGAQGRTSDEVHHAAAETLLSHLGSVFARAGEGDLEARILAIPQDEALAQVAHGVNHFLDVTDAFVRESQAALDAASAGRYHRHLLTFGLPGSFESGARRINAAQARMKEVDERARRDDQACAQLVATSTEISSSVAGAATELEASAAQASTAVRAAASEVGAARATVEQLETTSAQIQDTVELVQRVAAQTRMLALNARIESARAAEGGEGFAVVAGEVETLAEETARTVGRITDQVDAARSATAATAAAITRFHELVQELETQVTAVADASGGSGGLSDLAEALYAEIARIDT